MFPEKGVVTTRTPRLTFLVPLNLGLFKEISYQIEYLRDSCTKRITQDCKGSAS